MALLISPAPPDIQLAVETSPSGQVPLLLRHYSGFIATTDLSAPVPRIDTIGLAEFPLVPFSYTSRRQVPAVQHESQDQAHATSMPGAAWPVSRHPPGFSRGNITSPVSTPDEQLSTRARWFTYVRLLDPHLMNLHSPFP